uniref:Suppression of tumorigenicity 7 n=1 Tax=Anser brachyrhynchus TaxID=132585 RepID=A0A8B9BMT0_9AVES
MAEAGTGFLEQLKSCIVWSWTYLWTLWFFVMLFLVYILRVPLKINDNLTTERRTREPLPCRCCRGPMEQSQCWEPALPAPRRGRALPCA